MDVARWLPTELRALVSPAVVAALSALSVITLVLSTVGALAFITYIPDDYFLEGQTSVMSRLRQRGLFRWLLVLLVRQVVGIVLLLFGIATLVLPGQGLLTVFAALCVLEYPGKHRLIHRIVCQRHIQQALNSLRRRANKPPLRF